MFYGDTGGVIAARAKDICTRLLVIEEAERFYQWVASQADPDLLGDTGGGNLPGGFSQDQLTRLRATFADMHALWLIVHDQAPDVSYGISGTHDFLSNARHVIGP